MVRYTCPGCQSQFAIELYIWRCTCGGPLSLEYQPSLKGSSFEGALTTSLWRFRKVIPLPASAEIISLGEGGTPLVPFEWQGIQAQAKLDYLLPSGSYKDRGTTVLLSFAKSMGVTRVVEDSSGNAGSSLAVYAARGGIACEIFVPDSASPAKLRQIERCGAKLTAVPGDRQAAADAATNAVRRGAFYASHTWNPFFLHGTKTVAYEIWEQLGRQVPDVVIAPVGNGGNILGLYIGFSELLHLRLTSTRPRLVAVQAKNCSPIRAEFLGTHVAPRQWRATQAEGAAVRIPPRGREVVRAVRATGGSVVVVREAEITAAMKKAHRMGFYIEPTSALALAALDSPHLETHLAKSQVVVLLTGSGLKSPA